MGLVFESRTAESPLAAQIWRAHSESAGAFMSVASCDWQLVVTSRNGKVMALTVRGPETRPTPLDFGPGCEWWGIRFRPGTIMPRLPLHQLVDKDVDLSTGGGRTFWLDGAAWEIPDHEHADAFIQRLSRTGVLVRDPVVDAALRGQSIDVTPRSAQRRFMRATGLTHGTIRQIHRAERAMALLRNGTPILDVVHDAGYHDQAHLTRSMKRWFGHTPAQIGRLHGAGPVLLAREA
jgi:hypothetical protein